jgi:uncharacterized protein (DUF1800 family)
MTRIFRMVASAALVLGCLTGPAAVAQSGHPRFHEPAGLTEEQKIVHVLHRVGFGPRSGDVERVKAMGLDAYLRQQLEPSRIDDKACEKALMPLDTLTMSNEHFMGQFFEDIKFFLQMQMAAGNTEDMKMRFGVDLPNDKNAMSKDNPYKQGGIPNLGALAKRDAIRCMAELQQAKLMRAALSERQLQEVMVDFWSNHFNVDMRKNSCRALIVGYDRDVIRPNAMGTARRCSSTSTTRTTPSPANGRSWR